MSSSSHVLFPVCYLTTTKNYSRYQAFLEYKTRRLGNSEQSTCMLQPVLVQQVKAFNYRAISSAHYDDRVSLCVPHCAKGRKILCSMHMEIPTREDEDYFPGSRLLPPRLVAKSHYCQLLTLFRPCRLPGPFPLLVYPIAPVPRFCFFGGGVGGWF